MFDIFWGGISLRHKDLFSFWIMSVSWNTSLVYIFVSFELHFNIDGLLLQQEGMWEVTDMLLSNTVCMLKLFSILGVFLSSVYELITFLLFRK